MIIIEITPLTNIDPDVGPSCQNIDNVSIIRSITYQMSSLATKPWT